MNSQWRWGLLCRLTWLTIVFAVLRPATLSAQLLPGGPADRRSQDANLAENVFLPAERIVLQRLANARELLSLDRYGEAVRYLGSILDAPEDYFFQPDRVNSPEIHRSLKSEAQRLIGRMPKAGRKLYQLQYGVRARQLLDAGVAAGDAAGLAEVTRRFFHTQSGYEATFLLGLYHLDHGEPLAAALTLQRLWKAGECAERFEPALSLAMAVGWLQAGMDEKAEEVLSALQDRHPNLTVEIAGRQTSLFGQDSHPVEQLSRLVGPKCVSAAAQLGSWSMFRGGVGRNASTAGGAALLNLRWRIPTVDDPLVGALLRQLHKTYVEHDLPILPGLHPLAVDDVVLMRTAGNLTAVDLLTGKRLWAVPAGNPIESVIDNTPSRELSQRLTAFLGFRIWNDAAYGTISSDGRYVFSIEDLSLSVSTTIRQIVRIKHRQGNVALKPYNRLAAHDICTGKLKWQIGTPSDQGDVHQAGIFFLGPPLPLMGHLYVLGETAGEIRLFALDAESGKVTWSQQIAMAERNILADPMRRLAGASPSYADGILVCPTSTGAVVAVDLSTRSLLWGYRYALRSDSNRSGNMLAMRMATGNDNTWLHSWVDASVTVADGRVLATPTESNELHCLNLIDGTLLWKHPRQDDLYVACVHQGRVVLVGRKEIRALRLNETDDRGRPKPAWDGRTVSLPEGAMPSGRGFLSGNRYFIPLSTAEVVAVDLSAGRIAHVSKSRNGTVPGNLICCRGRVISQGIDGLEVFYQLDVAREEADRRLADRPDDAAALCLRGEVLLNDGKHQEAVECFRRAHELDDSPRNRTLLRDALLDGLKRQFAAYRSRTDEIESLLDDSQQRVAYLRIMATGFQRSGEPTAALDCYLKLADLGIKEYAGDESNQNGLPFLTVDKSWSVRLDRWVQGRLASLREELGKDTALFDARIETRLKAAMADGGVESLQRFLSYFGSHPTAAEARRELIARLIEDKRFIEAEMLLLADCESSDPATAGTATVTLAELLVEANRPEDAAVCYRRLGNEFAEVICSDGKTGKELLDALPADGPVAAFLRHDDPWPTIGVKQKNLKRRSQNYGRFDVTVLGERGPFFRGTQLKYNQNKRQVIGCDSLGTKRWQISLTEKGERHSMPFNPSMTYGRAKGHLLLMSMGYRIVAIDTLGSPGPSDSISPNRLWDRDLTGLGVNAINVRQLPLQAIGFPRVVVWQFNRSRHQDVRNALGIVTGRYVCFQLYKSLVVVDPLSGETLWLKHGITPGSKLFGDDRFVFAVAPNKEEVLVFRALDGEPLGTRKIPPNAQHLATLGSQVLLWNEHDSKQPTLKLLDVWNQRDVWPPKTFARGAKTCLVGHRAVGVLQPDGRFVLLSLPDGQTMFQTQLEPEKNLLEFFVLPSGDDYAVVTHCQPKDTEQNRISIQQIYHTVSSKVIRCGKAYMFDNQGRTMWPEPVSIENQCLLLSQPGRLPVLTFVCRTFNPKRSGSERYRMSILCIDKRTGRTVYRKSFPWHTNIFEISGDPKKKTVELAMAQNTVRLTFTDQADTGPTPLEAIKRAIRRAVE